MMLRRVFTRSASLVLNQRSWMSGFNNFNRNRPPKKEQEEDKSSHQNRQKQDPKQPGSNANSQTKPKTTSQRDAKMQRREQMGDQPEAEQQQLFQRRRVVKKDEEQSATKPNDQINKNQPSSDAKTSNQQTTTKKFASESDKDPISHSQSRESVDESTKHGLFGRRKHKVGTPKPNEPHVQPQTKQQKHTTNKAPEDNLSFEERLNRARMNSENKPAEEQKTPKDEKMKEEEPNNFEEIQKKFQKMKIDLGNLSKLSDQLNSSRKEFFSSPISPWKNRMLYAFIAGLFLWKFGDWIFDSLTLKTISYSELRQKIMNNEVAVLNLDKLDDDRTGIIVTFKDTNGDRFQCSCDSFETVNRLVEERNATSENKIVVFTKKITSSATVVKGVGNIASVIAVILLGRYMLSAISKNKQGGMGNVQNQLDKLFGSLFGKGKMVKQTVNVKFANVAGMDSAKKEITEFVDFLKNPARFHKLGARIPRGALLSGPPGTGKTLLAKACAGEAGVSFFSLSGSEFVEMYVGVGASRVRNLFKEAREAAPSIIFIDEIDAVGKKRSQGQLGGNEERDSTLNQLLVEMDGFSTKSNVVVFAATNKKELLDAALTRPGRFDRIIEVDLPDLEGRKQIFMVHLAPLKLNLQSMTLEQYAKRMATLTPGFSGADIANICNEAAIMAARKGCVLVSQEHFEMANDRVISGTEKKSLMTPQQRKIVAYHESGHAVVSWFVEGASPLLKLTIVPRSKGSLGFAQYLPDDKVIHTKQDLVDRLCVLMAGRITEEIFFNKVTSGAKDDFDKVSQLANEIVRTYGMTSVLGNVSFHQTEYLKDYSDAYGRKIDEQVRLLVEEAGRRARTLIEQHRDKVSKLAERLLEKDTIDNRVIRQVLGERPFAMRKDFKDYIENA